MSKLKQIHLAFKRKNSTLLYCFDIICNYCVTKSDMCFTHIQRDVINRLLQHMITAIQTQASLQMSYCRFNVL